MISASVAPYWPRSARRFKVTSCCWLNSTSTMCLSVLGRESAIETSQFIEKAASFGSDDGENEHSTVQEPRMRPEVLKPERPYGTEAAAPTQAESAGGGGEFSPLPPPGGGRGLPPPAC